MYYREYLSPNLFTMVDREVIREVDSSASSTNMLIIILVLVALALGLFWAYSAGMFTSQTQNPTTVDLKVDTNTVEKVVTGAGN